MIKMYSFEANNIGEDIKWTTDDIEKCVIRIGYNFMFDTYCKYKNINLVDGVLVDGIIKVMLSSEFDKAMSQCLDGITINGQKYIAMFATPAMMKQENRKTVGKCEMYFIKKEEVDFISFFENLISLGKLPAISTDESSKKVAINKDILARISLTTSTSHKVKVVPRICIVDNPSYSYLANYTSVDSEMQLHDHEAGTLDEKHYKHDAFDGCGLMSPAFADRVQEELKLHYPISWMCIRQYQGLATKGLVMKTDYVEFFREYADTYIIKDIYEVEHDIREVDMILNTSMCKWSDKFKNLDEVNQLINEIDEYYRGDLQYLYVTKLNKKEPKKYTLSNYQLMSNLALKPSEYKEIAQFTEDIYKSVINKDLDAIKLMLGDVSEDLEDEGEELTETTIDDLEDGEEEPLDINCSTKVHALLNLNQDFRKLYIVDSTIRKLITRKVLNLASGKMYLKGNYKAGCPDAIAYMTWLITGELTGDCTLKANEFFIPKNANKKLVASRNPLNTFSEVQQIETITNEVYEKYLGELSEDSFIVNVQDDFLMKCSGADLDGDIFYIVEDDRIYNAVIKPENGYNFINLEDGKKKELPYTLYNRFYATLAASGNLIGSLSNMGMKVADIALENGYYRTDNKEIYYYKEIADLVKDADKKSGNKRKTYEVINALLATGVLVKMEDHLSDKEYRDYIAQGFYEFKALSYYATRLQMMAIDAPKLLAFPTDEDKNKLDSKLGKYKPKFMQYLKTKVGQRKVTKYDVCNTNTAINNYAMHVATSVVPLIFKNTNDNSYILHNAINMDIDHIDKDLYAEIEIKLSEFYDVIEKSRKHIATTYIDEEKLKAYSMFEMYAIEKAEKIINEHRESSNYILKVLATGERHNANGGLTNGYTSRFIVKYFFDVVHEYLKDRPEANSYKFLKCKEEVADIVHLGEHYKRVFAKVDGKSIVSVKNSELSTLANRAGEIVESRVGLLDLDKIMTMINREIEVVVEGDNVKLENMAFFYPDNKDIDKFTKIKEVKTFRLIALAPNKNGKSANVKLLIVK